MWQDYSGYYLLLVPFRVKTQTRAEQNPLFFICAATRNWRRICTIRKQRKRDSWDVTICNKPKRILRSNVQSKQNGDKTFTLIRSKNQNFLQFLLLLDCLLLVSLTLFHWSRSFLSPLFPQPLWKWLIISMRIHAFWSSFQLLFSLFTHNPGFIFFSYCFCLVQVCVFRIQFCFFGVQIELIVVCCDWDCVVSVVNHRAVVCFFY